MTRSTMIFMGLLGILLTNCGEQKQPPKNQTENPLSLDLKRLDDAIQQKPQDATLYFKRGKIRSTMKQDSLALVDFQKAVQLDSTKAEYFSAIGDILFEHKDISGSVAWIQKAVT